MATTRAPATKLPYPTLIKVGRSEAEASRFNFGDRLTPLPSDLLNILHLFAYPFDLALEFHYLVGN